MYVHRWCITNMSMLNTRQRVIMAVFCSIALLLLILYIYFSITAANAKLAQYQFYDRMSNNAKFSPTTSEVIFNNAKKEYSQEEHKTRVLQLIKDAFKSLPKYNDTSLYNIDTQKSVEIGPDRTIPETRAKSCWLNATTKNLTLPKASIVIPFYVEHWSALLRTLYGIYSKTNMDLVEDIILVDDSNRAEVLREPLRKYLREMPKLKLIRTLKHEGIVRARMIGARAAWGEVLVILDGHLEFNDMWLPPLLREVTKDKSTIAIPGIDAVDPVTFKYTGPTFQYGSFDWELNYVWVAMPLRTAKKYASGYPVETATFLGCAMAVDKDYFFSLGGYDEDMTIWGGEALELSFRTWMCGGRMVIVPCSKIGHMFRTNLPYFFTGEDMHRNLQRIAEVWMDDHKKAYFQAVGASYMLGREEALSLNRRKILRQRLQCHSFSWYLSNVAKMVRQPKTRSKFSGSFKNLGLGQCVHANETTQHLSLRSCHHEPHQLVFDIREDNLIEHSSGLCLSFRVESRSNVPMLVQCNNSDSAQKWLFSPVIPEKFKEHLTGLEKNKPVGQYKWGYSNFQSCLAGKTIGSINTELIVTNCDSLAISQYWISAHRLQKDVYIYDNIPTQWLV